MKYRYSILKNLVHGSIVLGTKFKEVFKEVKFFCMKIMVKRLIFSKNYLMVA